jgi:hypothetical protein
LPVSQDNNVPANAIFQWQRVPYTTFYQLQISSDQNFVSLVFNDSTLTDTSHQVSLVNCVGYYWRVRAKNAVGKSDFTQARNFTIIEAVPSAPILLDPPNNKDSVDFLPTLRWATTDACSKNFRVQVSRNTNFDGTLEYDANMNVLSVKMVKSLDGFTDYYWRVKDSNSTGSGDYSTVFHFRTTRNTPPSVPVLSFPTDGHMDILMNPVLSWDSSARAESYRLQVALDPDFNLRILNDSTITTTSKQVGPLMDSTTYYWRVRAKNSAGTSEQFSSVWKFTTLFRPAPPPLVSPQDNITGISIMPQFEWAEGSRTIYYQLQVALDRECRYVVFSDSTLQVQNWRITTVLNGITKYYWRVRGKNQAGWGQWSEVRSFTTTYKGPANWEIPLTIKETGPASGAVFFGVNQDATNGIDPGLGEYELPPPRFGELDIRLIGPQLGEGLLLDLRRFSLYTQIDTYYVQFQPGFGTYPMTFSWSANYMQSVCDSVRMVDRLTGTQVRVKMEIDSTVAISNPAISSVMIIRYGAKPTAVWNVRPIVSAIPKGFMLYQNYPNPFNPSTQIDFSLDHSANIKIVVYDALGKEISLLKNSLFQSGRFTISWDGKNDKGEDMPSGVYFVRMIALENNMNTEPFISSRRMLLLK